jgi:cytidine deaminase
MHTPPADTPARLRALAQEWVGRAHSPFSDRPVAAILLLGDGAWIPGVRVESASYSLEIPAVQNALSTMVALGRRDAVALALSRPFRADDVAYLEAFPELRLFARGNDVLAARGPLPDPEDLPLTPFLDEPAPASPEQGFALARRIAERAHVPESDFPVACVVETTSGRLIPGVNVEHPTWSRILCAERNALGTLRSYGIDDPARMYLTCTREPGCTPCGACRQLLAELTPEAVLWMDATSPAGRSARAADLLPAFFSGNTLYRTATSRDAA